MDTEDFTKRFETLYRDTYVRAARRISDKRARLSPETTALLLHLSTTGPLTLGELARHTKRAQSTTSAMVAHLIDKDLLERDPDPDDARRHLIWLSPAGRMALAEAQRVLDGARLAQGALSLSGEERALFLDMWARMTRALERDGDQNG